MRPHKLIMKAFGPFAKETEVDFDAMGNDVYLITGATGSGKTTIFDGIVYTLFGKASGSGRCSIGNTEAFHSDYAKQGDVKSEMQLKLKFSNAGKEYDVERRMYWGKKGESQKVAKESVLYENGVMIANGHGAEYKDDVSKKIEEILGLDESQFRKIIMLAQGEFQQFLTANSDERGKILGKLYDNRIHQDFQNRLKAAYMLLKDRLKAQTSEIEAQIKMFKFPDDTEEEKIEKAAANHPELLLTLKEITEKIEKETENISNEKKQISGRKDELTERKTAAQKNNKLLDDLDENRKILESLKNKKSSVEELKRVLDQAVRASKIMPDRLALDKAEEDITENDKKIEVLEKTGEELAKREKELKAQSEKIQKENAEKIDEMKTKVSKINDIMHFYDDFETSKNAHEEKKKEFEAENEKLKRIKEDLEKAVQRQETLKSELEMLENAGDAAVAIEERRLEDAKKKIAQLENLKTAVEKTKKLSEEKDRLEKMLAAAQADSVAAEEEHLNLNKKFLNGQAGIIAEDLRRKLQSEETVICPVCKSVHSSEDADKFAKPDADVPSKEDVDKALEKWNEAQKNEKNISNDYEGKKAEYEAVFNSCMSEATSLPGNVTWQELSETDVINEETAKQNKAKNEAEKAYENALRDAERKSESQKEKNAADKNVAELEKTKESLTANVNDLETQLKLSEQNTSALSGQLEGFPKSKDAAEKCAQELQTDISKLENHIKEASQNHTECVKQLSENKGNIRTSMEEGENKKAERNTALEVYKKSLANQGFAGSDEYEKAAAPEGRMLERPELDAWISEKSNIVENYKNEVNNTETVIKTLETSTENAIREDTEDLGNSINELDDKVKELEEMLADLNSRLTINRDVIKNISNLDKERKIHEQAEKKLAPMTQTADDKYSFSRYVLGDFFEKIIDRANIHLADMTDGEYCLIRTESGDKRQSQGLGLKVLNTITNRERETATLSGGQSFEASLSLALGLSDIVQMESASTIQIDSMFIDEGFGSLDSVRLDKAVTVLNHLAAGRRQIGIISHVARLEECLPKKIHVIEGKTGSRVEIAE